MARRRDIAGSPVRTAGATWTAITELIAVTLGRSSAIEAEAVREALRTVAPAGHALVAGGHLDRARLTVVASPLYLTIGTVSGEGAFRASEEENLSPVPGAADAQAWNLYLPRPAGLGELLDEVADGIDHISTGSPPDEDEATRGRADALIDLKRLDPNLRS